MRNHLGLFSCLASSIFVVFLGGCTPPDDITKTPAITQTNPLALPVVAPIDLQVPGSTAELNFEIFQLEPPEGRSFAFLGLNLKIPSWVYDNAKWSEIDFMYMGKKPIRVELTRVSQTGTADFSSPINLLSIANEQEKLEKPGVFFTPLNQSDGLLIEPWSPNVLDYHAKGLRRESPYYHTTLIAVPEKLMPGRYKARLIVTAPFKIPDGMSAEFSVAYARRPK